MNIVQIGDITIKINKKQQAELNQVVEFMLLKIDLEKLVSK